MKKRKLYLALAAVLASFNGFAHKDCDLAVSMTPSAGYSTTVNYGDSCFFDLKITNNGPDVLTITDSLFLGMVGTSSISLIIPPGPIPNGGSFTLVKKTYAAHDIDTLRAADKVVGACFVLLKQSDILVGNPPRPVTETYEDTRAANDTACFRVTLKKRPANGIAGPGLATESLQLYPNPARDEVRFDLKPDNTAPVLVSVKDITGREVRRQDFGVLRNAATNVALDVRGLKPGLYFVEWCNGNRRATGKLVIGH
ncbi:T9SS type A sorting domain-containing protein [Taibaiella koreensis]|uniref:T9SS type A sorting domain-containing protein n=1 Tax=Taibaiella koreensis TaxID=1268548 RepID=UPI000E59F49A|nr:T9SS type A sorting domain-containing protein [Taibaiella koreensis]